MRTDHHPLPIGRGWWSVRSAADVEQPRSHLYVLRLPVGTVHCGPSTVLVGLSPRGNAMSDYMNAASHQPRWLDSDWDSDFVPPVPLWVDVLSGKPLLFPGEAHLLYCRPGKGKTWSALAMALWMALKGMNVLYIDYEGTVELIRYRLKCMGASSEAAQHIAYVKALGPVSGDAARSLAAWVRAHAVKFVVVDSVARALAAGGLDENSNSDLNVFFGALEEVRATGAALLLLDHVGHRSDGQELPSPRGASAKVDQVAVAYYFDQEVAWSSDQPGFANFIVKKDRFGVRVEGDTAARMTVDVAPGSITIRMVKPAPPKYPGVHNQRLAAELVDLLEEHDGQLNGMAEASVTLAQRVGGKKEEAEATIQEMVRYHHLVKEGKNGGRATISLPRPVTEAA